MAPDTDGLPICSHASTSHSYANTKAGHLDANASTSHSYANTSASHLDANASTSHSHANTSARHSDADAKAAFRDACTKHPDIATGCTDTGAFGGGMRPGRLHGSRGSRDAGRSGMVCRSTAALLIVARPPRPHSRLAGRAILLLALAAAVVALGCGRDAGGDAGPTATLAPVATGAPVAMAAPTALAAADAGVTPCRVSGPELPEAWQVANHVRWSPDGSRILFDFAVGKSGTPPVGLYGVDADGHQVREIVNPVENSAFSDVLGTYTGSMMYFDISPDGSRVAYSTCRYSTEANFELMVAELDGAETRRLTDNGHVDNYPAWSPDGSRIAFISSRTEAGGHDARNYRLYTMAADGSDVRLLGPGADDPYFAAGPHAPRWSPDGERLAFVVYEYDGDWEAGRSVYTVGADGSGLTKVADAVSGPAWSPDGERIAVAALEGEEGAALYTFAADGSDAVKVADLFRSLTELDTLFGHPVGDFGHLWLGDLSWSPDGAMVLFESTGVRVEIEDSFVYYSLLVSSVVGDERGPPIQGISAWSPDGSRIAVQPAGVHDRDRELRARSVVLYSVDGDGTDARVLARGVRTAGGYAGVTAEAPVRRPADADGCVGRRAAVGPESDAELVEDCR